MDEHLFSIIVLLGALVTILVGCATTASDLPPKESAGEQKSEAEAMKSQIDTNNLKDIYFAGGCFWGVEEYFSRIPGVYDVTSGYANGTTENPTYEEVCYGDTHFAETVHVQYDPSIISLTTLTRQFFMIINPLSVNEQGNDRGEQYRTGVYYVDEADLQTIQLVFAEVEQQYESSLATELGPLENFYLAEEYHQDYLQKNPDVYCHIDFSSLDQVELEEGADETRSSEIKVNPSLYSRPSDDGIQDNLTDMQYEVTQKNGTEPAFQNDYHDNTAPGLYVDIVTGEPLFASSAKYNSGCGWPAFTKPIDPDVLVEVPDNSWGLNRIEVRSRVGDSHLGHVFNDGPASQGGLRYCIDSAALRFIPYEEMEAEGYAEYMPLCETYGWE